MIESSSNTSHKLNLEQSYGLNARQDPLIAPHGRLAFETLGKLGEGGMGTVLKVRDKRNGREAALKIISEKMAPLEDQERFIREAQITMSLNHPSIPPVYELGRTVHGELFMLMKLIEGKTLKSRIQEVHSKEPTESDKREIIETLIKVGEALAYAHSRGIVHRDIKPANIMIGAFGEVLLMDWGIARDLSRPDKAPTRSKDWPTDSEMASLSSTVTGAAVGTPGYMAPEQANGDRCDERSDIYAFALVLAEALCGEALIQAPSPLKRLMANINGQRLPLEKYNKTIPAELRWTLEKCLQIKPELRPQKIEGLLHDLRALLRADEVPGFPYSWKDRLNRRIRKNPTQVQGLFLGTLLLASLLGLMQSRMESQQKSSQLVETRSARDEATSQAERLKLIARSFSELESDSRRGLIPNLDQRLEKLLGLSERSYESLLRAATILESGGQTAVRRALLSEAAEKHPPAYEALYELYRMDLAGTDDLVAASKSLQELIQRAQSRQDMNEFSLFGEGVAAFERGELDRALDCFDRAEQFSTRLPLLYCNRGVIRSQRGDTTAALDDFRKALELDPLNTLACLNRGILLLNSGDLKAATIDFDRAVDLSPHSCIAVLHRGIARYKSGNSSGALEDLRKAAELSATDSTAKAAPKSIALGWYYRGLIHKERGKWTDALGEFNKAVNLDPSSADALFERGLAHSRLEKPEAALADLDAVIRLNPKHWQAYFERARLRSDTKDHAGARSDLDKTIELNPKQAQALASRALIHRSEDHPELAFADADRALALDPTITRALRLRGALHHDAGRLKAACQDYRRFLELNPDAPLARSIKKRLKQAEAELARRAE